jgi:hypothetical protein
MTTRNLFDDTSSFRIRRSLITTNGIASHVDENVKQHLDELNKLLGKPIFSASAVQHGASGPAALGAAAEGGAAPDADTSKAVKARGKGAVANVAAAPAAAAAQMRFLSLTLTPKHIPALPSDATSWDDESLAGYLAKLDGKGGYTLADYIDKTPELAQLKYAFLDKIQENWALLPFNSRVVLENYPNITDYLIASVYHKLNIRDEDALRNVIVNNRAGTRLFADYAAVSAARWVIHEEQLKVDRYNANDGQFVQKLTASTIPLSALSFEKVVRDKIREFVFDRDEEKIIRSAKIFRSLPADLLPQLVKYIQQSTLQLNEKNIDSYLPGIVLQIMKQKNIPGTGLDSEASDEDFRVQFEDDSDDTIEINKSAVLCAAQLYHGMVMGEELDIFGAVHYLAHRRMNTFGGMRIEDPILRDDLQRYVFDNRYIDIGDKKSRSINGGVDKYRTRPAERQMFHRQVFDEGSAEIPEDMLVNGEFKRLWKVLMLESARYLDRAQASMNPESFVSRQNVMQAVEDLQYNLSTHCTGMATVISPAVDAELNFVLERILKHKEILRQVVPEGGTWKRALDKLNGERRRQVGPATTLYNKATLGKGIIEMIADYTPAAFENDGIFSAFISKVDAFVTTQSILQRPKLSLKEPDEEHDEEPPEEMPGLMPEHTKPANGELPADEWDF